VAKTTDTRVRYPRMGPERAPYPKRVVALREKKRLDNGSGLAIIITMASRKRKQTMTELLRKALHEADSLRAIERATDVKRQSMMKFMAKETSLRLDKADVLAAYFGIEVRRKD